MSLYNIILLGVIILFSAVCSYQDLKTLKIGDYPLLTASYAAVIVHLIFNRSGLWIFIISGMFAGFFYYVIRLVSGKKLGIGDVYFGFFQGFCLNFKFFPVCVLIEIILTFIIMNKKIGQKAFPFVPFMSAGLIATYLIDILF